MEYVPYSHRNVTLNTKIKHQFLALTLPSVFKLARILVTGWYAGNLELGSGNW